MLTETDDADLIDGHYAWYRLGIALMLSTVGGISLWSSVVSLPAIEVDFAIDRGDASLPYMATMAGFAAGGILMGRISDRFGVTVPLLIGTLMLGIGYYLAAQAENLWQFVAVQALFIGGFGGSAFLGPLVADISMWFKRRRGIAVAIVASGNYLSGAFWPPLMQYAIEEAGWRQAHIWIAVTCIVVMIPLIFVFRRPPPDVEGRGGVNAPVAEMPMSPRALQILLVIAGIACCIAMSMPQVHIVAYCVDLGYGAAPGAKMLALMLGFGVVSRLASGMIADRIGGLGTLMLGTTLQCLALFLFLPFDGLMALYLVSAMFGLSQGGIVPSYALIVRDYFPAREAATRVSLVLMMTVAGMAIGGWMSGEIQSLTGSYDAAFLNGIAFNLVNISIAGFLMINRMRAQGRSA
ncbi:MAG: MFS transporter [Rhodospirillaceae bacterium]